MSPSQLAQIRLRLDRVAEQRAKPPATIPRPVFVKAVKVLKPLAVKVESPRNRAQLQAKGVTDKPVSHAPSVTPKTAAQRKAAQRAKNPEAARQANTKHQRASRAKKA